MSKKFNFKSEKKKRKWNLFKYEEDIIDKDIINTSRIEMLANKELTLDGCMGVEDYDDSYIKLKLKKGCIIIYGQCFDIISFEGAIIRIKGKISSLEFCC